ncbi:acyl-CoA desaturase [Alginatibacterium sediminis]|uniref:Acyl-CoA desaturase n=1 Tax=Alginatibacterium sediminis TaxID=2164068 RepID=A0A420EAZ8_9ALTE|nr:fatty acid desaturase [Alginatibacterium sediminis]RKF17855.1 acyl-CoA desaturase [Alginatibacterium sediminis]
MSSSKPPLLWLNVFIFTASFVLGVLVTPWYAYNFGLSWVHFVCLVAAFSFSNLSITAGYHRLWSHKTYQANWVLRLLFAIGGALSLQNSALHWSSYHREHHKHVDHKHKDPYSASRGFWYSHIGWMLREYSHLEKLDYKNCRDLKKDKIVMWQHQHYAVLALLTNLGMPLVLGLIFNDILGMFLVVGALRLLLSHHSTFFINSLAHIWGRQTFTDKNSARDNGILAILTFGEGYHNFHHLFENDYRNGVYWWHYDPTKWLIASCSWFGLSSNLRTTPQLRIEKARAKMQLQMTHKKMASIDACPSLIANIEHEFEAMMACMASYYESKKQLLQNKRQRVLESYELSLLKQRHQQLKADLKQQRQIWRNSVRVYA